MLTPRAALHRPARRWFAAATALLVVLSGLFGAIHEIETRHVRCEHGELTHADITGENHSHPGSETVAHDVAPLGGRAQHEHEHCGLAAALRTQTIVPRQATIAPAIATDDHAIIAIAQVATAPHTALYRTAPKTSPPA